MMLRSIMPRVIWDYRYFIFTSVLSDFKNQVARSKLGFFWLVAAPLSQVLILAVILIPWLVVWPQFESMTSH
ncbi:MAG: hypothetical protein OIF58_07985, partial [Cohaesibacter sp.]|nr:hypothetical protein [Cohaesibacter sp.]